MAKKNVVEIVCDRCDRTEYIDPDAYREHPDLALSFGMREENQSPPLPEVQAVFNDLCSSCRKTVRNLSEQIAKKISWKRGKPEEELEDKKEEGPQ